VSKKKLKLTLRGFHAQGKWANKIGAKRIEVGKGTWGTLESLGARDGERQAACGAGRAGQVITRFVFKLITYLGHVFSFFNHHITQRNLFMSSPSRRDLLKGTAGAAMTAAVVAAAGSALAADPIKLEGKEVQDVSKALHRAQFRKRFVNDPNAALKAEGLDPSKLNQQFLDALKNLSSDELEAIASIQAKTAAEGLTALSDNNGYIIF
jgi:hypothetical protein